MRYCGSIHTIHRVATQDCEIAGFAVRKHETVRLMLAAANHDPQRFADPETLDLGRKDARHHVGFGYGIHTCLGMWLTRLEVEVALGEILRRYPDLAIASPFERHRNITLHGPTQLHLSY
jgi:cytochrome P450